MASLVEKYQQILAADPRSRIFVELARALVDRGDHARAIEICRQGLEHHPGSILGRVTWGRALLAAGDTRAARDQFDVAIGIDPANPYAYDLVGEALLKHGLFKDALPVLARALELAPADAKVKGWLEEARRRAGGGTAVAIPAQAAPEPPAGPARTAIHTAQPAAAPVRPVTRLAVPAVDDPAPEPQPPAASQTAALQTAVPQPDAPQPVAAQAAAAQAAEPQTEPEPEVEVSDEPLESTATTPPEPEPEPTQAWSAAPAAAHDTDRTEELTLQLGFEQASAAADEAEEQVGLGRLDAELDAEDGPPARAAAPVLQRTAPGHAPTLPQAVPAAAPAQPAGRAVPGPRTLLTMIPPTGRTAANLPAQAAPAGPDPEEAARQAAAYERELREAAHAREAAQAAKPPSKRGRLLAGAALLVVAAVAVGAYVTVKQRASAEAAGVAVEAARAGLARDTKASLAKAAEVLAEARDRAPSHPEVRSLSAQVAALLAVDHGDDAARALARSLSGPGETHDGALAARLLLAEQPGERSAAAAAVLAARPGSAPLLQRLAGRLLLAQGQLESGRGRLDLAAHATPPLLGALADLGDSRLQAGDAEGALPFYEAALSAHPTHPRSAIGAAEARLALGRPLDASRQQLAAVEQDPGSAPPRADRLRFELAAARIEAASGDAMGASRRLTMAAGALGDSAALQATRATLLLDARLWDPAAEAAAAAVRLQPSADHKLLLARAQLGQRQPAAALQALAGLDSRTAWLERGIALHQQGQHEQARAALERTMRDGRMPAEAATWYALCDVASGRADKAVPLLERLATAPGATAATHAALGRAYLGARQPGPGEAACRAAIEKDARAPEGHACLGAALLGAGKAAEAVASLETALSLDRADPLAQRLLAEAKTPPKAVAAAARPPAPKGAPPRQPARPAAAKAAPIAPAKPVAAAATPAATAGAGAKGKAPAAPPPVKKAPISSHW